MTSDRTEHPVQTEILEYLALLGVEAWRNNVGRRGGITFGKAGLPDILGFLPDGRFLAIEVKRPKGGRNRPKQVEFIDKAKKAGAVAFFARSVEEVQAVFAFERAARGGREWK